MNYISLFSSAGVGCYGFKMEGFECISTVELLEKRINIQKLNKKCVEDEQYVCGNIELQETKDQIYNNIERAAVEEVDVIIATPPCQGMSLANHKKNESDKRKNSLVVESIEIISNIKPKIFIFENVQRFLQTICTDSDGSDKLISDVISEKLSLEYDIHSDVINFKNFGANSSRTRTLLIGVKKDNNISPLSLFPSEEREKNLKQIIGKLPRLKEMGEIHKDDIFHQFRNYDKRMLPWIQNTDYGDSAFNNKNPRYVPHRIVDGKYVKNKSINGNKYQRQKWENVAPCIHTRNDILASQNTVHPEDDRVFSIRELMLMMNIPNRFRWSKLTNAQLNKLSTREKMLFLKENEMNIRQSIGEAVPTIIFQKIAKNIKKELYENI